MESPICSVIALASILAKRARDLHKAARRLRPSSPQLSGEFFSCAAVHHMAAARLSLGHRRSQEVKAARVAHRIAMLLGRKGVMCSRKVIQVNEKSLVLGYGVA